MLHSAEKTDDERDADARRQELGKFLRARRESLEPGSVGIAVSRRRRSLGLRREEVASFADVSVTWYAWLEQGRPINAARETLERIAHALRLSPTDTRYVIALAIPDGEEEGPESDPRVQLMVDTMDPAPAFVTNHLYDVIAFNPPADRIYRFSEKSGRFGRNQVWNVFGDPEWVALYRESWPYVADMAAGIMRVQSAALMKNPRFAGLLEALQAYPEFTERWTLCTTRSASDPRIVTLFREELGLLRVHSLRLMIPDRPGYLLYMLAGADEETKRTLATLRARPTS